MIRCRGAITLLCRGGRARRGADVFLAGSDTLGGKALGIGPKVKLEFAQGETKVLEYGR